jgi:predicted kinase
MNERPTADVDASFKTESGEAQNRHVNPTPGSWPPARTDLSSRRRVVFVGRTGSGKTTLARDVAELLRRTHVELDALHFRSDLSTVPVDVLRDRTIDAVRGECWIVDGNKKSVRDLVWPRADTIVWLDYPLVVSLWRLGRRAITRTSSVATGAEAAGNRAQIPKHLLAAARGVVAALRSHAGQRRTYPVLFASPENAHLEVIRLRSPRAARGWLAAVSKSAGRRNGIIRGADDREQQGRPRTV